MQKYPDATIKKFEAGFLPKIFLAFKHYRDKNYIKDEFVSLLMFDTSDASKIDKINYFFEILTLYLCHLSDIGDDEFNEKMEKLSEPLKSEAMTTYKRLVNKGVEIPVINAFKNGYNVQQIVDIMDLPLEQVRSIIEKHLKSQGHGS